MTLMQESVLKIWFKLKSYHFFAIAKKWYDFKKWRKVEKSGEK